MTDNITHERVTQLLLDVMEFTYNSDSLSEAEKKVLDDIRAALKEPDAIARAVEAEREACKKLAQEHAAEYRVGGRLYAPLGGNYALCAAVACDHIVHLIEERGRK